MASIEDGIPRGPCRVVSGSRAEGLAMEPGWGYLHPDTDTMIIYGGEWTVWPVHHTPSRRYLCLNKTQCFPGFYRVEFDKVCFNHFVSVYTVSYQCMWLLVLLFIRQLITMLYTHDATDVDDYPIVGLVHGTSTIVSVQIPYSYSVTFIFVVSFSTFFLVWFLIHVIILVHLVLIIISSAMVIHPQLPKWLSRILLATPVMSHWLLDDLKWCKKHFPLKGFYLSSREALNLFGHVIANSRIRPFNLYRAGGPTYRDLILNQDLVLALLCDNTDSHFVNYHRKLPKLLIPVGHPQSPNIDLEWRESHSLIEIEMARNWPVWVKQAYWAFKYTFQHCMDASFRIKPRPGVLANISSRLHDGFQFIMHIITGSVIPSRACVRSYHLKTTLIWVLDERHFGKQECPYLLFMLLVNHLATALEKGNLPNYFTPGCNLLDGVSSSEIDKALSCLRGMLADPLSTMMSAASKPDELYGPKNGFHIRGKLLTIFKDLDRNVDSGQYPQKIAILRSQLLDLDSYRKQRYVEMRRRDQSIWSHVRRSAVNHRSCFNSLVDILDGWSYWWHVSAKQWWMSVKWVVNCNYFTCENTHLETKFDKYSFQSLSCWYWSMANCVSYLQKKMK